MEKKEDLQSRQDLIDQDSSSEMEDFQQLDVLDRLERVAAVLREEGATIAEVTIEQRVELQDQGYLYLGDALELLIPERVGYFSAEPFGAYTEQELRDFYPDTWAEAASIAGWKIENLRVELEGDNEEATICVRATAFGKEHEWFYRFDSSYADPTWGDHLHAFAAEYLDGCYLFDPDDEVVVRYAYLPRTAATRLKRLFAPWLC